MITVENTVKLFEVDGQEVKVGEHPTMRVTSHGNWDTLIVLEFAGKSVTVSKKDLDAAIQNAVNSNRYGR